MSQSQSMHTVEDGASMGRGTQLSTAFTEATLDWGHFAEACLKLISCPGLLLSRVVLGYEHIMASLSWTYEVVVARRDILMAPMKIGTNNSC